MKSKGGKQHLRKAFGGRNFPRQAIAPTADRLGKCDRRAYLKYLNAVKMWEVDS